MIPRPEQLESIAGLREGTLDQVPFAVLLHALAQHRRSCVLAIERPPLEKKIVFEDGWPIDCRSNLVHETFGRFLVDRGLLTEAQAQQYLQQSVARGELLGETLIRGGALKASALFRLLQESLAKKLLDGFTWRHGRFHVQAPPRSTVSPLKVKVPQLVVTGIGRFARQDEVDGAIGQLVGKRLFVHPTPPYALADIRLTAAQRSLAAHLDSGKRIDELAAESGVAFDVITRLVYALAVLGIVVTEAEMPAEPQRPKPEPPAETVLPVEPVTAKVAPAEPPTSDEQADVLRDALMSVYLSFRQQDAFDLLGLETEASHEAIEEAYLRFLDRFAVRRYRTPLLVSLVEKAEDLLLAAGRAFGELTDVERRNALIRRRKTLQSRPAQAAETDRFAIKSDLLDPRVQYGKGKALMDQNRLREAVEQLQYAHDFDPQNSLYRCELAYARFLHDPAVAEDALAELRETVRIDPKCGLAYYYAGEVATALGQRDPAEQYLTAALKLLQGDRRPIEALKVLRRTAKPKGFFKRG